MQIEPVPLGGSFLTKAQQGLLGLSSAGEGLRDARRPVVGALPRASFLMAGVPPTPASTLPFVCSDAQWVSHQG